MPQKTYPPIAVIGLDCAPPELVFDAWIEDLPNLQALTRRGLYGKLESTIPPITVPAWMCMMTSRDPGTLGIYGFRNRKDHSYTGLGFASSLMVKEPTVYDLLGEEGARVITLGVPLTWPPKPVNGLMVSGFPIPPDAAFTNPPELQAELDAAVGGYIPDVKEFRTKDKDGLLDQLSTMTRRRFAAARHLVTRHQWDFFMMVEMATDRLHHAFWSDMDPAHPKHVPANPRERVIHDYYVTLDAEIGSLLAVLPEETLVAVVSDHGAKKMDGGICFNEWLIQEGYLTLKSRPPSPVRIGQAEIDWSRTIAWGDGGYYGRCFINVKGREPEGTVEPADYEAVRNDLARKLEALTDEAGRPIGTRVFRPESVYERCNNIPPDLIVYFGDLNWRSVGTVGTGRIWTHENDTGPDDANHSQHGLYVLAPPAGRAPRTARDDTARIYDIAPTLLSYAGAPVPRAMLGRNLLSP
ncbi:MAG TPA: alkaline phosphatase family protein [Armatimonadota bacterium]|jgi:predicted AlkP superfamily phosphohydrolase/phosphomutase